MRFRTSPIRLPWLLAIFAITLWGFMYVTTNEYFELDGDIANGAPAGTDWAVVNAGPVSPDVRTGVLNDPNGATIFTVGGSKDTESIAKWQWTSGNVPDKDNITNAYAYAKIVGGQLLIFFGADRYTTEGNANFGFWFTQQKVGPQPGSTAFEGRHTDGDLLVVTGYEQGGKVPVIRVYEWQGNDATGGLVQVAEYSNNVACTGDKYVCVVTNTANINLGDASGYSPAWSYTDKDGGSQIIKPNAFIEGGINVTALLNQQVCYSSFLAETRSSTSETAQLKDFVAGAFNICGLSMTKACGTAEVLEGSQIRYQFTGTVTNIGIAPLYNVKVVDTPTGGAPFEVNIGTVGAGATVPWEGYYTVASTSVLNSAKAVGTIDTLVTSETVESDPTTPVQCSKSVSPSIEVTKTCAAFLEAKEGQVVVRVDFSGKVKNTGDVNLTGLTLGHDPSGASITFSTTQLAPGAEATYTGKYYPAGITLNGLTPGRYWFEDWIAVTGANPVLGSPLPTVTCKDGFTGKACASASCPICPKDTCANGIQ